MPASRAAGNSRRRMRPSTSTVSGWVAPRWSSVDPNRYGMPRPPMAIRPSAVRWAYMYTWALSPIVS